MMMDGDVDGDDNNDDIGAVTKVCVCVFKGTVYIRNACTILKCLKVHLKRNFSNFVYLKDIRRILNT